MPSSLFRWLSSAGALVSLAAASAASCGDDARSLSVDLRTDLVPGTEFGAVVTRVDGGGSVEQPVSGEAGAFLAGTRVADFAGLADGEVLVDVTLLSPDGEPLVSRISRVALASDYALTVVVTRSCAGVTCPEPEGDPSLSTCQAGRCTSPECTPDTPELCPEAECGADADCRTENPCLAPRCDGGVCLFPPNDALCPEGLVCNPDRGCVNPDGSPACEAKSEAEASCSDGEDDDCDGRVDCADPDCGGLACEDGDACTEGETCQDGQCAGASPVSCDDENPCTDDSCDPKTGCAHEDNDGTCDDGDACTEGDTCANGVCSPGAAVSCDDENPCTDDSCDPASGCGHANNAAPCDDGLYCNGPDACAEGSCSAHPSPPCAQFCNETTKTCAACQTDADCGAVSYGAWGTCGGYANTCDESGTQSRTVTTPVCQAGACTTVQTTEEGSCSRNTDGKGCGSTEYGAWGSCGGFSSACDETGTRSRTVTTYKCSAGGCSATKSTQSESCTRNVANGTSCGAGNYCCGGSCVPKSGNNNCGGCGIVCPSGFSCGQPVAGEWGCHCSTNAQCQNAGYGGAATCYGGWCNCQCSGGYTTCGACAGGATCHDVSGQNYCSY